MTYLSFVLTHAGTFAYRGKGEVTCDVPDETPHAWSVSLRLSHAEADEFDAWHDRQAPLHLSTEPDGAASVHVEAVERHDRGARATLRGAGYCPVPAHAGPEAPSESKNSYRSGTESYTTEHCPLVARHSAQRGSRTSSCALSDSSRLRLLAASSKHCQPAVEQIDRIENAAGAC